MSKRIPKLADRVQDRPMLKSTQQWNTTYNLEELRFAFSVMYNLEKALVDQGKLTPDVVKLCLGKPEKLIEWLNQQRIPKIDPEQLKEMMQKRAIANMTPEEKEHAEECIKWHVDPKLLASGKYKFAEMWTLVPDLGKTMFYQHIEGGSWSPGVFVIEVDRHGLAVIKEGKESEAVVVAAELGRVISADSKEEETKRYTIPKMRCVTTNSRMFQVTMDRLLQLEKLRNKGNGMDVPKFKRIQQVGKFVVMDYMSAFGICELPDDSALVGKVIGSQKILWGIGAAVFFDMLINNWDRIPVKGVWTNDGNPANIMFSFESGGANGKLVLINQSVRPIKVADRKKAYQEQLRKFTTNAFKQFNDCVVGKKVNNSTITCMHSIREFITMNTCVAYDVGINGELEILKGFCSVVRGYIDNPASLSREFLEDKLSRKIDEELYKEEDLLSNDGNHALNAKVYEACVFIADNFEAVKQGAA